jgi:tetratricopeptide (TPR) repeat protein
MVMEEQQVNFAAFNPLDYVSGVLALGGAIAGAVTANVAAAAFPLAGAVGCHLYNRQQLMKQISERMTLMAQNHETLIRNQNLHVVNNSEQIKLLQENLALRVQELQASQEAAVNQQKEEANKLQQLIVRVADQGQEDRAFSNDLEKRHEELNALVKELRQIENFAHTLRSNPKATDIYYQLAASHQRLGDIAGAIADLSEAVKADPRYAPGYHQRGILFAQSGNRKAAVEDLRQAAKLYFDMGDIESYQQAKELGKEFYEESPTPRMESLKAVPEVGVPEALAVAGLFEMN